MNHRARLNRGRRVFLVAMSIAVVSSWTLPRHRSASGAATAPSAPDEQLLRRLGEIDARAAHVIDLAGHFEQQKFTALLKRPLISSGRVRAAGSTARWDTDFPDRSVLYIDGKELRLYYPSQQAEEIYPIDQRMGDMLSSPLPRLATVRQHFSISSAQDEDLADLRSAMPGPRRTEAQILAIRLTPIEPELSKHIQEAIVVIDPVTALAIAVETIDADDDRTVITFSDMKLNTGIMASDLDLIVPSGTRVSHPLEGMSQANPN